MGAADATLLSALQAAVWPWPLLAALLVVGPALWHTMRVRRMRTVFVSYRRSDSASPTAELVNELRRHYGRRVFHDVDSLRPGEPFRAAIARTLWRCDAALVMIGPGWATVAGGDGSRRLWADDDVVRSEVATALDCGALVVPVLVDGAAMPQPDQLPPDLRALPALNALRLPEHDAQGALSVLNDAIRAAPLRRSAGFLAACHAAVLAQLLAFAAAGGLLDSEWRAAVGVVLPPCAAVLAAAAWQRLRPSSPARAGRSAPLALALPLAFVALSAMLVLLRSLNVLAADGFQTGLILEQAAFAAYSGVVVLTLRENRPQR